MDGPAAEIAIIEQELAQWKSRQANIAWSARFILPFCILAGVLVSWFLGYSILIGDKGGMVAAVLILAFLAGFAFLSRDKRIVELLSVNWGFYPNMSYAQFLEQKIADCEKRLTELKSQS